MAKGQSKKETKVKVFRVKMAELLTSVSYGAMTTLCLHHAEEAQRRSEAFMSYVKDRRRHELRIMMRGQKILPMFHAGHKIKPDNWDSVPVTANA